MKIILLLFLLLTTNFSFAQTFNLGRFSIGKSRVQIQINDFIIHFHHPDVEAKWVSDSVQWIRNENNLLVPRALLKIGIKKNSNLIHINYQNHPIVPVKKALWVETQIYIDLFNPDDIKIFAGPELLDTITIEARDSIHAKSKQLIDYSCSPYELKIGGIDSEYLSIGCKMNRIGDFGSERSRLEITMSSTNLKTINGEKTPFTFFLNDSSPVDIELKTNDKEVKKFHLQANVPQRLNRLKTSFGFGPYIYQSQEASAVQNANLAPSLMIYAKFDLTETASIKAFDALLYSKTFFNNSGLYFSYDLAEAMDGRVIINALLGFQGIHYQYSKGDPTRFRLLYPQGFEVLYKHAFIENYNLFYGMFLSTSSEKYTNAWIRYGKKNFLELNYIDWQHDQSKIRMWGLSIGIPFFSVL